MNNLHHANFSPVFWQCNLLITSIRCFLGATFTQHVQKFSSIYSYWQRISSSIIFTNIWWIMNCSIPFNQSIQWPINVIWNNERQATISSAIHLPQMNAAKIWKKKCSQEINRKKVMFSFIIFDWLQTNIMITEKTIFCIIYKSHKVAF